MPWNDTRGEIGPEDLAALRANAQTCITCGQLATVDPQFHATRYAHPPLIRDGGQTLAWSAETMSWQPVLDAPRSRTIVLRVEPGQK